MKTENIQFETINGGTTAFAAAPDNADAETPAVILIQEWWGLNDHIKDIAMRFASEGFRTVAPDLYRGRLAANSQEAGQFMQALEIEDGIETIKKAAQKTQEIYGARKFGITGFCMGGTYALRAACELEYFHAAAPFYGDVPPDEVLRNLKTPVVFFAGVKDKWINPEKVAQLERTAEKFNLPLETISYQADHAFFNNTRPEVYDANAANDAWAKVIQLFNNNL